MADELLSNYQHVISDLKLIPGSGGAYEVNVDGDLIYSKYATKRHANEGEVFGIFQEMVGSDVPIYGT